jgi:BlaR1 peptidase M56
VSDPEWTRLLARCQRRAGVTRPVRLLRSLEHVMPMAFGIRRPVILIPCIADTWSDDRRRAVLLHELAHIGRHDCVTQLAASIACACYWIHPGVWWIARRLRVERELACDDRVLAVDANARDYAGHLLDLAYALGGARGPALAVSMARRSQIEGRLLAVLDPARNRRIPARRGRLAGIAIAAGLVMPLAAAQPGAPPARVVTSHAPAARSILTAASSLLQQDRQPGTWEMRPTDNPRVVHVRITEDAHSSHSFTIGLDRLEALSGMSLPIANGPVHFSIRRDAGTFTFDGTIRSGVGVGTFTFAPSATFPADMVKRGFARPTPADQYTLARSDVGFAYLDELNAQQYARPELAQLVRAAQHGVDLEYLRGMGQVGYHLQHIEALVTLRDHGVTPQYVREMGALGLTGLSPDDAVRARDHGVDPQYVGGLKELGYGSLSLDALVDARDHGLDPGYARDLRELGYRLTLAELRTARDHGVDPGYVRAMDGFGYSHLSLEALVDARNHGIDPDYVGGMRQLGYQLALPELIRARNHGVDPAFTRGISDLGYQKLSLADLIRLRDHGVTPEYVREQNDRRHAHLTIDELVRLRDTGYHEGVGFRGALDRVLDDLRTLVGRWL